MVAAPLLHVLLICPAVALGLQLPSSPLPSASFTSSMRAYKDAASACAAVARDPASGEAWRCLGRLLHGKGRLEAARTALTRATELAPTDAATQIGLANVLRSIGRFDEAVAALAAAESLTGKQDQSLCYFRTPGTAAAATPAPEAASLGGVASRQVLVSPIASREECEWVIATAEACSWGNPPPRYAPAGTNADAVRAPHMLVADSPELLRWLNAKLEAAVWPILAAQFGRQAAEEMWLYDAFLLKFDKNPMRSGLGVHVDDDGLGLSFNLLLSSPDDFEGGGTWFEDSDETVTPQQGEMVSHHGGLRHASVPTGGGLRYIMVGFLRAPTLIIEPPDDVTGYCVTSRLAAASSRGVALSL